MSENFVVVNNLKHDPDSESLFEQGLTLVHPFYNEPKRFEIQYENWKNFHEDVKAALQIVISDDCSEPAVSTYLKPSEVKRIDFNLRCYRIMDDLEHNTPGALNLGIQKATTDWVLIMDSDCLFNPEMMFELMKLQPNSQYSYWFPRNRITTDPKKKKNTRFLPCTILFHKKLYETIGGFDEDFTGEWNGGGYAFFDNDFSERIHRFGFYRAILNNIIATEYMEDFVGPNIQQKNNVKYNIHYQINKKIWQGKLSGKIPRSTEHLRFQWIEDFKYERW